MSSSFPSPSLDMRASAPTTADVHRIDSGGRKPANTSQLLSDSEGERFDKVTQKLIG